MAETLLRTLKINKLHNYFFNKICNVAINNRTYRKQSSIYMPHLFDEIKKKKTGTCGAFVYSFFLSIDGATNAFE